MSNYKYIGIVKIGSTTGYFETKIPISFNDNIGRLWFGKINKDTGTFIGYIKSTINKGYDLYYCILKISNYMYNSKFINQIGNRFLFTVKSQKEAENICKYISNRVNK